MNKGLINLWYENQNSIDVLLEELEFKNYGDLLFNFFDKIIGLKNCKNIEKKSSEDYEIEGIYEDKELKKTYSINVHGYLKYGTCEMCDLYWFLHSASRGDKKKMLKLILLNIIQNAYVDVDAFDCYPEMKNFTKEEFIEEGLCYKIDEKWSEINYPQNEVYKEKDIFAILYFLMTYLYVLGENPDEKIKLLNKKLICKEELSNEEIKTLNLDGFAVAHYPVRSYIEEIARFKFKK